MDRRPPDQPDGSNDPRVDFAPILAGDLAGAHIDAPVNLVRD